MRVFITLIVFAVCARAWAYPIFFTCNADKSLGEVVTPQESARALNRLLAQNATQNATARQNFVTSLCDGGGACMRDLEQILSMAETIGVGAAAATSAELSRIRSRARDLAGQLQGFVSVPPPFVEAMRNVQGLSYQVALARECREATQNLESSRLRTNEGFCVMANSRHSPYMYPSGIRDNNSDELEGDNEHGMVQCAQIDSLVDAAVGGGHDPYTAMAVSLMENATDVDDLYLDPIGVVGTLGCPSTQVSCSQSHNLNSYDTCYRVQFGVRENPRVVDSIANFLRAEGTVPPAGTSFYCNNRGGGGGHITATALPDVCCVRLPFDGEGLDLDKPVVIHSFARYFRAPLQANHDSSDPVEKPARRLQRYNGWSQAMGGAEPVSTWRAGVNYFNTPTYGYQAMDFLLNTVMNNPYVVAKVREAEAAIGRRSPSILCEDLAAGSYAVDSEVYFNRHREAPRLSAIKARVDAGASFNQLPSGFRNVLFQEIEEVSDYHSERFPRLAELFDQADGQVTAAVMREYFTRVWPERNTVGEASRMDQGFSWNNEMSEGEWESFLGAYAEQTNWNDEE